MRSIIEKILFEDIPTGHVFEDDFEEAIKNAGYKKLQRHIGDELDIEQGTDFTLSSLRLDPTLKFSEKNFMPFTFDTKIEAIPGMNFQIGVRHGNSHQPNDKKWKEHYSEFDQPVAVIGIDMNAAIYKLNKEQILKNLQKNADVLLQMAETAIEDYTTIDSEERKDLLAEPLRPNTNYNMPKNISTKYKRYNQAQMIIMADKNDFELEDFL